MVWGRPEQAGSSPCFQSGLHWPGKSTVQCIKPNRQQWWGGEEAESPVLACFLPCISWVDSSHRPELCRPPSGRELSPVCTVLSSALAWTPPCQHPLCETHQQLIDPWICSDLFVWCQIFLTDLLIIEEIKGLALVAGQLLQSAAPLLHRRLDLWGGGVVLDVHRCFARRLLDCSAGRAEQTAETKGVRAGQWEEGRDRREGETKGRRKRADRQTDV